jgi:hypothetical protein
MQKLPPQRELGNAKEAKSSSVKSRRKTKNLWGLAIDPVVAWKNSLASGNRQYFYTDCGVNGSVVLGTSFFWLCEPGLKRRLSAELLTI